MADLARGGQGNHASAEHGDGAAAAVAGEVEGLLSKPVQAGSLIVCPDAPVDTVTVWNDLPAHVLEGGIMIEVGDLWSGEQRKLALTFAVPARAALGLARIATLELRYVTQWPRRATNRWFHWITSPSRRATTERKLS